MPTQQITAYHCATQAAEALDRAADSASDELYYTQQIAVADGWRRLAKTIATGPGIYPDEAAG